jgi:hypothetical protein
MERGPTVILNLPDKLQVYCTPLEKMRPDLRWPPLSANPAERARFHVWYAVGLTEQHHGDSQWRA